MIPKWIISRLLAELLDAILTLQTTALQLVTGDRTSACTTLQPTLVPHDDLVCKADAVALSERTLSALQKRDLLSAFTDGSAKFH